MTEKQGRWQKRNRILWRLKGMGIPAYETSILTAAEIFFFNQGSGERFSSVKQGIRL